MQTETKRTVSLADVQRFFGVELRDFRGEWAKLTDTDKQQIRQGLEDGTFNY